MCVLHIAKYFCRGNEYGACFARGTTDLLPEGRLLTYIVSESWKNTIICMEDVFEGIAVDGRCDRRGCTAMEIVSIDGGRSRCGGAAGCWIYFCGLDSTLCTLSLSLSV